MFNFEKQFEELYQNFNERFETQYAILKEQKERILELEKIIFKDKIEKYINECKKEFLISIDYQENFLINRFKITLSGYSTVYYGIQQKTLSYVTSYYSESLYEEIVDNLKNEIKIFMFDNKIKEK